MDALQNLYKALQVELGSAIAQYAVPLAAYTTWTIKLNLREAVHLCELRSGIEGHPTYRWVAQEIYKAIAAELPDLAAICFQHVNLNESVALERLSSEQKQAVKQGAL
jgi:thymidylate synthase ThyX